MDNVPTPKPLLSKGADFRAKVASPKFLQTVRKLTIRMKMVDQNTDFRVQSNFERSEASKIEAKFRANVRPREFSHSLRNFWAGPFQGRALGASAPRRRRRDRVGVDGLLRGPPYASLRTVQAPFNAHGSPFRAPSGRRGLRHGNDDRALSSFVAAPPFSIR